MFTPKIWLRLGVFAVAGSSAAASPQLMRPTQSGVEIKTAIDQVDASGSLVLAEKQRRGSEEEGGEGGEAGETRAHRLPNASKNIQEHKRTLMKYRLLDRRVHGFGLAFSVEPEWHLYSELTGRRESSYA